MSISLDTLGVIEMKGVGTGNGTLYISGPNLSGEVEQVFNRCLVIEGIATRHINESESGSIIMCDATADCIFTLPIPDNADGCNFRFIIKNNGVGTITVRCPATTLYGVVQVGAAGAATQVVVAAGTNLVFIANQVIGAYAELYCDGDDYYCSGSSGIAGGITLA